MNEAARILLIDDDPSVLLAVGDQLRMEGYEVALAESGDQALQLLRTLAPDLIILDIGMPGMTGLAFLKKISGPDSRPRYPVLIFTARANMERFFTDVAVEGFLAKTSDPSRLLEEVQRITLKRRSGPGTDIKQRRRRVLIVENDPRSNARLSSCFSAAGYETVTLPDTTGLIEAIQAKHPDVLLIREILPGVTGSAVAANLAPFTTASGIAVVLYDNSNLHKPNTKFANVSKFVPTDAPPDLLRAVAAVTG